MKTEIVDRRASASSQWDEVWEGVLHMPPMPNGTHQDFSLALAMYLTMHWARPRKGLVRQEVNLTTEADASEWQRNYRIPDLVLVSADRRGIDRNEVMVGAPLVVVEIASPGDESREKLGFYAGLGVPEVWIFDRDTKELEAYLLVEEVYEVTPVGESWWTSPGTGVSFRSGGTGKLRVRMGADDCTLAEIPDA